MPPRRGFKWESAAKGQLWEVVGGRGVGGVPVQIDQDPSSRQMPTLLATGSIVEQVALFRDARLQYELISGAGPKEGWLSIVSSDGSDIVSRHKSAAVASTTGAGVVNTRPEPEGLQLLAAEEPPVWDVVRAGVHVSISQDERSATVQGSLQKGARLRQLRRDGNRLQFKILEGDGPGEGWLSILKAGKPQVISEFDLDDVVELQSTIQQLPSNSHKTKGNNLRVSLSQGVAEGQIVSVWNRPLVAFADIPFATFAQRFAVADGAHPWVGARDGRQLATVCPQEESLGRTVWMGNLLIASHRDSSERGHLCVSIHTPLHALAEGGGDKKKLLPVEAHIHGGLVWGFPHNVNSSVLSATTDFVNVDISFRVGLQGCFAHPELSAENGGCSGAWRCFDCLESLLWIKKNISKFGGDPDQVLCYSVSGGCAQAMQALSNPLSAGLVKAIYLCSPPCDWILRRSVKTGRGPANPGSARLFQSFSGEAGGLYLQELWKCKSLADIRARPILELLDVFFSTIRDKGHYALGVLAQHCIDGDYLRGPLHEVVDKGLWPHPDVPIVIEMSEHEGDTWCFQKDKFVSTHMDVAMLDWTWDSIRILAVKNFGRLGPDILKVYARCCGFAGEETKLDAEQVFNFACRMVGDVMSSEGPAMLGKALAAQGVPVYFMEWQWIAEEELVERAGHSLQSVFSHPSLTRHPVWRDKSYEIAAVARGIMKKFIETGSPGWPKMSPDFEYFAFMTKEGTLEVNLPGQREALIERWKAIACLTAKVREEDAKDFGLAVCAPWRSDLLERPHSMLPEEGTFEDDVLCCDHWQDWPIMVWKPQQPEQVIWHRQVGWAAMVSFRTLDLVSPLKSKN